MKVITCFSYKGGAGRTTAAANIATALASITPNVGSIEHPLGCKVALIDLDVFSAGTHRVFEISNEQLGSHSPWIQEYMREEMSPREYADQGGITLDNPLMDQFRMARGAADNCHPSFTLFPAKPDPDIRFVVQKQHENVLVELLMELESKERSFDYVILDGESGTRQMADIAIRLADVVLMFFRLTWQHIEGSLVAADDFERKNAQASYYKPFYLIPTCVPLVLGDQNVYRDDAPGLAELVELTSSIPEKSYLNRYAQEHQKGPGHFWAEDSGSANRLCVHDSLYLKGEERVIVFDAAANVDQAASDFYRIAVELNRLHQPSS